MDDVRFDESLIILSDVHLGNDLNELAPDAPQRSAQVDADLVSLIAHYRRVPSAGRWRLVIAGDFIDFIGMALLPRDADLATEPSDEERLHGLGNTADHARIKLRAAIARHRSVFVALAAFLADGHAMTIVHGNHDVEFHWDAVKEELRSQLATMAAVCAAEPEALAELGARVEFAPWFYYVGGVAYVEHGHQYDMLCSTELVMAPLSPRDPRRIARTFSDVLLRWVVRPTRGMPEYGHERMGIPDYVVFGLRLGMTGVVRLVARFAAAVIEMFRLQRASLSEAAVALREEHERRMAALAAGMRVGLERLRALAALQVPPATRSTSKILAGVLLDCLAVAVVAPLAMGVIAFFAGRHPLGWGAIAGIGAGWALLHRQLKRRRRAWFGEHLDNDATLVDRAGRLARLFPAAFVVMGHTHTPARVRVADGAATYVNVGSWHEAEAAGAHRAARTHLVIHPADSGATGEFLAWGPEGPHRFEG
jgi:UDP-2,3-diacylglucosamine pyrophosphatase LpxH